MAEVVIPKGHGLDKGISLTSKCCRAPMTSTSMTGDAGSVRFRCDGCGITELIEAKRPDAAPG